MIFGNKNIELKITKKGKNMEFSLDKFESYDIWLLFSIGFSEEGNDLESIIARADGINHAIFMREELNFGLNKLVFNGFVEQIETIKFRATQKAIIFREQHKRKNESYLSEMCRLSNIFVQTPALQGCKYIEYVSEKDYKLSVKAYHKKMNEILKSLYKSV